jgi:replicative DNA helicase
MEQLEEADFYKSEHRMIFSAIKELFDRQNNLDLIALENYLRDSGQLESVGGQYLVDLTRSVSSATHIETHCKIVRDKATLRNLIESCERIKKRAYDPSEQTDEVLDYADRQVFEVINNEVVSNTHEGREVIQDALEHMLRIQAFDGGVTGIPTGLDIDRLTAGWQDSNMIVVAARPSMGKTAFTLHCLKAAAHSGNAALLSLETSYRSIGNRLIISEAGIDGQKARKGQLSDQEIDKAHKAASKLLNMGIIVDDTTSLTASKLRAKGKALKKKYDIQMLAVDFIQLMLSDKDNREQQVAHASRACKLLCKELDIPVLVLSQLNRGCESRHGISKRPQLSDLRESGAIEQDADVVMSLFRPEYYDIGKYPETEGSKWAGVSTDNICELIVNKQKDGPTGMVRQLFDKETMRFANYTPMGGMEEAMNKAKKQKEKYAPF